MEPANSPVCETPVAAGDRAKRWVWTLFALWVLLDLGLFYQFLQREVVWSYPPKHDQLHYLYDSFHAHESILTEGPLEGIRQQVKSGWLSRRPQGVMVVPIEASLLYLIGGASRTTALMVNFLHFIALQVAVLTTLLWASGRWNTALLGLGLLLTALFPFAAAGGLYDFRLDFASFCMWGIVTCLVLRSGPFRSFWWSIGVGVAASVLIWARFITLAYFGGILGIMLPLLACRWLWRWKSGHERSEIRRELVCLSGCGVVMALMVFPILYLHRDSIYNYYVVNHVTGPEKSIRAQVDGLRTTFDHIAFYPKSVLRSHIGWTAGVLLGATLLVWTVQSFRGRRRKPGDERSPVQLGAAGRYLLASVVVPIVILAMDEAKSGVVGAVVVTPLILLAMVWVIHCQDRLRERPKILSRTGWALATAALLAAVHLHSYQFASRTPMSLERRDNESVVAAADVMAEYALANRESNAGYRRPRVVMDGVYDFMNHGVLNVRGYERFGTLLGAVNGGGRIFDVTREEMLKYAGDAHFIVMTLSDKAASTTYPFDKAMMSIRPHLRDYCEANMRELTRFRKLGREFAVYVRDCINFSGDEGGWITPSELTVVIPPGTLSRIGSVVLKGRWPQIPWDQSGKPVPKVHAFLDVDGEASEPLEADLKILSGRYELTIHCQPHESESPGRIRFRFDGYFVPAEIGPGKDTRQLVALSPDDVQVNLSAVTIAGGTKERRIGPEEGMTLSVPRGYLKIRSRLEASGVWTAAPGTPVAAPRAMLKVEGQDDEPLEAQLVVEGRRYRLLISWEQKERPADGQIVVTFPPPENPESKSDEPAGTPAPAFVAEVPEHVLVVR